ncbi:hypothetical protein B0H16DRAFT_1454008 [Mycena metata]|uniref:Uncharacterized protein n=1 Tax=Mycena metata TaxID=1033252 RepID=A0AAD7JJD9_9AGAR|nr:hypothetical protein B0H16DRAFT_1454008 [Mycena metata]
MLIHSPKNSQLNSSISPEVRFRFTIGSEPDRGNTTPCAVPAKDAAAGSNIALSRVENLISSSTDAEISRLFLPALYAVLQRARIPNPDELDTEDLGGAGEAIPGVYTVIRLLKGIAQIPPHVVAHMWPLLWDWISFLTLHPPTLRDPGETEDTVCQAFAATIFSVYGRREGNEAHPPDSLIRAVVDPTIGVHRLMIRAWVNSLERGDMVGLYPTSMFILRVPSIRLDECVDGAGGTQWHLASFVVKLLHFASFHPREAELPCRGTLVLICQMNPDQELRLVLLECKLFGALTKMLNALLTEDIGFNVEDPLQRILSLMLLIYWTTPMIERWMAEGLKADLLPALISITQRKRPYCAGKLFQALTTSLVHYRVAVQMEKCLPEVLPVLKALIVPAHKDKLCNDMMAFLPWAAKRADFSPLYRAHRHVSNQACDNMKRNPVFDAARDVNSVIIAQRFARQATGTRLYVGIFPRADFTPTNNMYPATSDYGSSIGRSFMCAVFHRDYQTLKATLLHRHFAFVYENPDVDFYCVLDYKSVPPTFGAYPLKNLPCTNMVWADAIARARRSGGRMEIHLMNPPDGTVDKGVVNGRSGRERIFPLRSSRADIYIGIRAIARSLPPGVADVDTMADEIENKVARLMEVTQDVVQVHCR